MTVNRFYLLRLAEFTRWVGVETNFYTEENGFFLFCIDVSICMDPRLCAHARVYVRVQVMRMHVSFCKDWSSIRIYWSFSADTSY